MVRKTAKRFNITARGRAAHPGNLQRDTFEPQRGVTTPCACLQMRLCKPVWQRQERFRSRIDRAKSLPISTSLRSFDIRVGNGRPSNPQSSQGYDLTENFGLTPTADQQKRTDRCVPLLLAHSIPSVHASYQVLSNIRPSIKIDSDIVGFGSISQKNLKVAW
jgi:hypothetical protein